jgi:hypothetical protein
MKPSETHLMYVWHPYLDDYLRMGWMFAGDGPLYTRGEHLSFLMEWPCTCKMPYLKKRD